MPKTLYQELAIVADKICVLGHSLKLNLETPIFKQRLALMRELIEDFESLEKLCETSPPKVLGYNVQPMTEAERAADRTPPLEARVTK